MNIPFSPRQHARSLTALALTALLAGGTGFLLDKHTTAGPAPLEQDSARALARTFREIARSIGPSVVSVVAIHDRDGAPALFQQDGDPRELPFGDRFFWHFFDDGRAPMPMPMPTPRGQGSGVILDQEGTIATNYHVVAGATRLQVTLQDGRQLSARVAGTDPDTDLAILRVDETGLPAAQLGDSDALEPGDWVMAVGNPFGLDHTVTVGVVSAKERSGVGVATYEDFIQTDAAINPGNSGGPLVDLDGRVIGINTAIRTSDGGSNGIGFAIPSSTLKGVLPDLLAEGRVSRGWLGVSIQRLTPELARSFGVKPGEGVLVSDVVDDTPAEKAGLRAGDIIVALNDESLDSHTELSQRIAALDPGDTVALELLRDGKRTTMDVTLAERPPQDGETEESAPPAQRAPARWGVRLGDLDREGSSELRLDGGAVIREVLPGSPAEDAGLMPGDVILSVDDHQVESADECVERLRSADASRGVRLLVHSRRGTQEGTHYVFLEGRAEEGTLR